MGQQVEQAAFFHEFRLKVRVLADPLSRRVDAMLDLSWVREHMAGRYGAVGCPLVCTELTARMLLVGCLLGIRSERLT